MAKERADGLTLDSPIVEIGHGFAGADGDPRLAGGDVSAADSPRKSCPNWKPAGRWSTAVEKYLGTEPRAGTRPARPTAEIPAGILPLRPVPGVRQAAGEPRHARGARAGESVLRGPRGRHQRPHDHRRPRVDQLLQLQLPGHVGRSGGQRGGQGGRSTATAPASRPAGWCRARRTSTSSWSGRLPRFLGTEDAIVLRRRSCHERDGDRPPDGARAT